MYKIVKLRDKIRVSPDKMGMELEEALYFFLRERYERTIDKDIGIIVAVISAKPTGEGVVVPGDPGVYYEVEFESLSYFPVVNEVLFSEVNEVVDFGTFVTLGPIDGLVHLSQITSEFLTYNRKTQVITGKDGKKSIKKGDVVLAKISTVSLKPSVSETKIGLTMRPHALGKIEWSQQAAKKAVVGGDKDGKEKKEKKEKHEKEKK
jgi:DNA-directed RNA polymerase subunit E'